MKAALDNHNNYVQRYSTGKFAVYDNYHSLLLCVDCFAENKSFLHFENLDWCLRNNSFEDGGGTCAIVGAILAGSSSDKEIWRSTGPLSSILRLKIFAIKIGI